MPPFSRGVSGLQLQPRARFTLVPYQPPLSKFLHGRPPNARPTRVANPFSAPPKPSPQSPLPASRFSKLKSRYGLALLRHSSATLLRQLRKQYERLPRPVRHTVGFVYLLGIVFALILPPVTVFRNHFYDIIRVTGPSMSPYLNTDFEDGATGVHDITKSTDRIVLNLYRPQHDLRRGMVVAFRTPHDPEKWAIKRIVALQGDEVFPLAHYPDYEALNGKGLIIPFGHMWVEGDVADLNKKDTSMDSNMYGPISTGLVMGKATHVITSLFSKWTAIDFKHFELPERVHKGAVTMEDLDEEYQSQQFDEMFQNGIAAGLLRILRTRLQENGSVEKYRQDPDLLHAFQIIKTQASNQLLKDDSQTSELASDLLALVEQILGDE